MTLHRFNGDEIYHVESATIEHYKDEDGQFAVTFRADAGAVPIQTLPDTYALAMRNGHTLISQNHSTLFPPSIGCASRSRIIFRMFNDSRSRSSNVPAI